MGRDIDISLIRAFLAVAESGGMTSAAHALNLTQGAVSQKIKRLEELFDTPLFERKQRTLTLTPAGERLMSRALRMIALNDETWQLMTKPAYSGEIRLGVPLDVVRPILPQIMRRFNREHPSIRLTLVSDMTTTLLESLKAGDLDLTLTTESRKGRKNELLLSDKLVWVGALNGEACFETPLPVSLGSDQCAFRAAALEALNKQDLDWLEICSTGNLDSILATVEADMAIAPYLSRLVPEPIRAIELNAGLPKLPVYHINLRMPASGGTAIAKELAKHIRQGFSVHRIIE